jgi:hypothetical protein
MTDGYIGIFQRPLYPDPIDGVVLTEVADTMELTWDIVPSGVSSEYEVWSSVGSLDNFEIIAIVSTTELASGQQTITVVDNTYEAETDVYYKVYHKSVGYYSDPLQSGIAITYSVPDPTNLTYEEGYADFSLTFTPPTSRLWSHVEIYKDAQIASSGLNEGAALLVYSGKTSSFTYDIPDGDRDKYHQFWISSVTKT